MTIGVLAAQTTGVRTATLRCMSDSVTTPQQAAPVVASMLLANCNTRVDNVLPENCDVIVGFWIMTLFVVCFLRGIVRVDLGC